MFTAGLSRTVHLKWRDVRYLYDYNRQELEWLQKQVNILQHKTKDIYIVFNNNSREHAAKNAKEFISMLNIEYSGLAPKAAETILRGWGHGSISANTDRFTVFNTGFSRRYRRGVIVVPALMFFGVTLGILPSITPQTAVGTSSMLLIFTGMSAMISYAKKIR